MTEISGNARHAAIDALIEAGFVDPDDGTVPRWRDNEPVPVWTVPAQVVDVVLAAALPHLRAHQTPRVVDREALERVLRERMQNSNFTAIKHEPVRTQVIDQWVQVFADAVQALLPIEAETKALAETATKLGYELGRKEAREEAVADLRFLAAARKDYCARCPETQNDYAEMRPAELAVHEEHTAATRLADILDGKNDGMGWLPSWRWDEWAARKQVEA